MRHTSVVSNLFPSIFINCETQDKYIRPIQYLLVLIGIVLERKNGKPPVFPSSVYFCQETGRMGPNISSEISALRDRERLDFHRKSKYWEGSVLVFLGPPPLPREGPSPFRGRIGWQGLPVVSRHPRKRALFHRRLKKKRIEQITSAYMRTCAQIENCNIPKRYC